LHIFPTFSFRRDRERRERAHHAVTQKPKGRGLEQAGQATTFFFLYGLVLAQFFVIFLSAALKAADRFVSCFGSSRQTCYVKYNIGLSAALKAADKKTTKKLGYG
jgi:hypothetical protein